MMSIRVICRIRSVAALTAAAACWAGLPVDAAESVADFYRGKQVRVVIGSSAGDGIDVLVRTVARHLGKHLPGNPTFIPQNMPGAGSRVAANWLYNVAPQDGTAIGNITANSAMDQALKEQGVQFDVAKFNWIGNPLVINSVILTWTASGLLTVEDVKRKGGLICGGSGGTSPSLVNPQLLNNLIDGKIRIVSGYKGNSEIGLAMERGEVNCLGSTNLSSARVMFSSQLNDRRMNVLVQFGTERELSISDFAKREVPVITEFAGSDSDRRALNLITSGITFGRPILMPPGVPQDRIDAMRRAFDAAVKDPEFLADAERQKLDINPVGGVRLQRLAVEVAGADDVVVARTKELTTLRDVTSLEAK